MDMKRVALFLRLDFWLYYQGAGVGAKKRLFILLRSIFTWIYVFVFIKPVVRVYSLHGSSRTLFAARVITVFCVPLRIVFCTYIVITSNQFPRNERRKNVFYLRLEIYELIACAALASAAGAALQRGGFRIYFDNFGFVISIHPSHQRSFRWSFVCSYGWSTYIAGAVCMRAPLFFCSYLWHGVCIFQVWWRRRWWGSDDCTHDRGTCILVVILEAITVLRYRWYMTTEPLLCRSMTALQAGAGDDSNSTQPRSIWSVDKQVSLASLSTVMGLVWNTFLCGL